MANEKQAKITQERPTDGKGGAGGGTATRRKGRKGITALATPQDGVEQLEAKRLWTRLAEVRLEAKELGKKVADKARRTGKEINEQARGLLKKAKRQGTRVAKQGQQVVRKHPAKAVGVAIAAGVVAGLVLGRSGKNKGGKQK